MKRTERRHLKQNEFQEVFTQAVDMLGERRSELTKTLIVEFMIMWVRWMWPRFRYDQLMDLGWRRFIPLALVNIVLTAAVLWWRSP